MILDTRTCNEYHSVYECTPERVGRAVARKRQPHDLHGVHAPLPDERRLPGLPQGEALPEWDGLLEMREAVALPSDQGPVGVFLPVLRDARLPHGGHHFSQVDDELAALVLGDLPSRIVQVRDFREAARTRDRRHLQDRASDAQADSDALGRGHWAALGRRGGGRVIHERQVAELGSSEARCGGNPQEHAGVPLEGRPDDRCSCRASWPGAGVGGSRPHEADAPREDPRVRPSGVDDLHGRVGAIRRNRPGVQGPQARTAQGAESSFRTMRAPRTWSPSSPSSRTRFAERTTRSARSTSRTTWTSTRSGGTTGTTTRPCFGRSWIRFGRIV